MATSNSQKYALVLSNSQIDDPRYSKRDFSDNFNLVDAEILMLVQSDKMSDEEIEFSEC